MLGAKTAKPKSVFMNARVVVLQDFLLSGFKGVLLACWKFISCILFVRRFRPLKGVGEGGGIRFVGEGEQLIIYRPANHDDSIVYLN